MDLGLGFDQAAIGMALVGLDGRFLRVNRALCELLGRSEAELLDSTIADLAEPGEDPVLANLGRMAAAEGAQQAAFQVERSCRRADGAPSTCSSAPPCCTAPTASRRASSARSRT
jgi:PAS domain S-box-containing protein